MARGLLLLLLLTLSRGIGAGGRCRRGAACVYDAGRDRGCRNTGALCVYATGSVLALSLLYVYVYRACCIA